MDIIDQYFIDNDIGYFKNGIWIYGYKPVEPAPEVIDLTPGKIDDCHILRNCSFTVPCGSSEQILDISNRKWVNKLSDPKISKLENKIELVLSILCIVIVAFCCMVSYLFF